MKYISLTKGIVNLSGGVAVIQAAVVDAPFFRLETRFDAERLLTMMTKRFATKFEAERLLSLDNDDKNVITFYTWGPGSRTTIELHEAGKEDRSERRSHG
ncbi:hypothetical protein Dsin_013864 [Dipteronia sinensis]|uniref:Uncharacterized protein n=1 Tax=Dipteronia sinensis TaxID=43782 RepID=A0AAE0E9I3_9ROSI|nr:hypothetical protein Dsin_013864 [Dipteronia sinensis]